MTMQVTLEDIKVMYVESPTGPAGAKAAFDKLESRLSTLKGRKFYETFQHPEGPYRACVQMKDDDDLAGLALKTWIIPGGKFVRDKLDNWTSRMDEIGRLFKAMAVKNDTDPTRPGIEFFRSQKELLLFLPVK